MIDYYESIGDVMGGLGDDVLELETMILNGENEIANRYLREAAEEIRCALSDMSDALFEISASSHDYDGKE